MPPPPLPNTPAVEMMPYTSEFDFLLFSLMQHSYYMVDSTTQMVYEGNHRLINFLYHHESHYPIQLQIVASDGSWGIVIQRKLWIQKHMVLSYGKPIITFQRAYPQQRYTQAQIEQWAKLHPNMNLSGDGHIGWGKDNPAKSYIVVSTHPYILFLKKEDDGLFRKVWELYGGIELNAGIMDKQGIIHAVEGHGISDPAMIYIQAETGVILSTEPTVQLTHRRY